MAEVESAGQGYCFACVREVLLQWVTASASSWTGTRTIKRHCIIKVLRCSVCGSIGVRSKAKVEVRRDTN